MGQFVEQIGLGHLVGLRLVFRRHLAGVHHVEHLLPALRRDEIVDLKGQVVEPHLALLHLAVVAVETMLLEQHTMPVTDDCPFLCFLATDQRRQRNQRQDKEKSKMHEIQGGESLPQLSKS